jgi:hypothetical protein
MKLHEFKGISSQLIECEILEQHSLQPHMQMMVWVKSGQCYIQQVGSPDVYPVEVNDGAEPRALIIARIEQQSCVWVLSRAKDSKLWLSSITTTGNELFVDLDIGVGEYFCQQLFRDKKIKHESIDSAIDWLNDEFLVKEADQQTLAFAMVYDNSNASTLNLLGKKHAIQVSEINQYWQLDKLTVHKGRGDNYRVICVRGQLSFQDAGVAAQLKSKTMQAALQQSLVSHGDYIQLWEKYSQIQWEQEVSKANAIGLLQCSKIEAGSTAGEWKIYAHPNQLKELEQKWNQIKADKPELQIDKQKPDWLDSQQNVETAGLMEKQQAGWRCKIQKFSADHICVKYIGQKDRRPPSHAGTDTTDGQTISYAFLSIAGTLVQRQRQLKALDSIRQQRNPLPALHSLLQGVAVPTVGKVRKLAWKSQKTRSLFKGGHPTLKQQQAIELGLNSTDMAIIIGPPGTGKTKVITAMQQRIAEEQKETPLKHLVLLTSYQHDAVENVLALSNVMGLAGVRVGGKNKHSDDDEDMSDTIRRWSRPIQANLEKEVSKYSVTDWLKCLKQYSIDLALGDATQRPEQIININRILDEFKKENIFLDPEIQAWWDQFQNNNSAVSPNLLHQEHRYIRALRTTTSGFADDGVARCIQVAARLKLLQEKNPNALIITPDQAELLEQMSMMDASAIESSQLDILSELKNTLLDRCLPDYRPRHVRQVLGEQDCKMLTALRTDLQNKVRISKSFGYLVVLDEYRAALNASTESLQQAIKNYTAVLGATCQQAAGRPMQKLKLIGAESQIIFENVIVDEAARATPLDLMIPMAMARKRLVLVGDHRQLPHMTDDAVEKELVDDQEWSEVQQAMLKESLFKRMVEQLKTLENEQQQPKRVIMLDTQFRMHRVLGDFISQNFYENHGLPAIKTTRPDSDFVHGVPNYEQAVCVWKNIPQTEGAQQRCGTSWHRCAETEWIAQEARRILNECPELSVGVISFYAGQRDSLFETMIQYGLTEKSSTGEYTISEAYRSLAVGKNTGDERLRIGTVDAFQGKEFDVVLVSLVRTLPANFSLDGLSGLELDQKLTSAYGFLRVDNRLNVALSRQRSLLIMVGDIGLAKHPAAQQAAPALSALIKLCQGGHGFVF